MNHWDDDQYPYPPPTPRQVTEAAATYGWWPAYPWLSTAPGDTTGLPPGHLEAGSGQ